MQKSLKFQVVCTKCRLAAFLSMITYENVKFPYFVRKLGHSDTFLINDYQRKCYFSLIEYEIGDLPDFVRNQ